MKKFRRQAKKQAQSLIEYGLILALVAIVALTVMTQLGGAVTETGNNVGEQLTTSSDNAMRNYCTNLGQTYNAATGNCSGT